VAETGISFRPFAAIGAIGYFFFRRIRAFELPPAQLQRSSARASIGLQNGDAPGILHRSGDIVLVTTGTTLMVMPRRTRRRKIHGCNYLKQKKRRADRHSLQFGRCALCTTPQMWKKTPEVSKA